MRVGSLVILGVVFFGAFAGRAGVLAARAADGATAQEAVDAPCINGAFAEELLKQAEQLEAARAAIAESDQKRAVVLRHVNERITEYEKVQKALSVAVMKNIDERAAAAERVAALYEKMKPDLAGAIIAGMDPSFAASLLASMSSEGASAILGALSPDKAYAITVLMADAI